MDVWEAGGQQFEVVMASNVPLDGMGLELTPLADPAGGPALEAFFSDRDQGFTFRSHRASELPFEIVERFVQVARERLPSTRFECPVCGASELSQPPYEVWPPPAGVAPSPPYEDGLGTPSYEVCPNCGFEFGNDDNPGTASPASFEGYREEWVSEGRPRFNESD